MFKFLILLALSLSCGSSHSELKIIGGKKVGFIKELSLSTVGIFQNSGTQHCSGTLIKKNQIITASHCLERLSPKDYYILLEDGEFSKKYRAKKHYHFLPKKMKAAYPIFDVATIILENDVDSRFKPISVLTDESALKENTKLKLLGYGKSKNRCANQSCSGVKKSMDAEIKNYLNYNHLRHLIVIKSSKIDGACNGDSGGPAFIHHDGSWKLAGITNGVDAYITPNASTLKCEQGDVLYTYAGRYLKWANSVENNPDIKFNTFQNSVTSPLDIDNSSLKEICLSENIYDDNWFTTDRLLNSFKLRYKPGSEAIESMTNCEMFQKTALDSTEYKDGFSAFFVMLRG